MRARLHTGFARQPHDLPLHRLPQKERPADVEVRLVPDVFAGGYMSRFLTVGMLPPAMRAQAEAKLRLPSEDSRFARSQKGGIARARNNPPEKLRAISLMGVKARMEKTTPEQRTASARRAGQARWVKHERPPRPSDYTGRILWQIKALKLPEPVREYRFHAERRWRFDLAWPALMLAVELDGLTHEGGRHQRPRGYTEDARKLLAAAVDGWTVLRVVPEMVRSGEVATALEWMLKFRLNHDVPRGTTLSTGGS